VMRIRCSSIRLAALGQLSYAKLFAQLPPTQRVCVELL
jgi:hypothetical protein